MNVVTSRWRKICVHPSKNGGRSKTAQNSEVRMSTHLDTHSRTQMAKIMVKHWRPSGFSRTKLVGRITVGKEVRTIFIGTGMGEDTELGMLICAQKTRFIPISIRGWHYNGRKEAEHCSHVEEINERRWSWWTNIIPWSSELGMHYARMRTKRRYCEKAQGHVRVTHFCWNNRKITKMGQESRKNNSMVLHGETRRKVRCEILWIRRQKSGAIVQSFKSLLGWSPFQEGRTWNSWRIVRSVLTNCIKNACILVRIGRPDILWSMSKLARSVTKWTQACDGRFTFIAQETTDNIITW